MHQQSCEQKSIGQRVKEIVLAQFADQISLNSTADIENDAHLVNDLGADSLDSVELIMAIEDEFGMEISDEEAEKIATVQQMIDYAVANARQ